MPITLDGSLGVTTPMYNGSITANAVTPSVNMKNRIINGQMVLDQRNAGASVTPANSAYTLDRWQAVMFSTSARFSVQQDAGAVTPPAGFTDYLGITSLSAHSVTGNDIYAIGQNIEGFNIADLGWGTANAKTVTLSFWVRSSLTGTFGGAFSNANNRSYPFTYTISSANTWEYKTITVAGDTSGTWNTTNGAGIQLRFGLGAGATSIFAGTAGAWNSNNNSTANGTVSVVGTNGATFYLTGVQLEVGSTATSFDYRPYGTELVLCQRYCEVIVAQGNNAGCWPVQNGSSTNGRGVYSYKVQKRAAPTFTNVAGTGWIVQNGNGNFFPSAVNLAAANPSGALIDATCTGLTSGQASMMLEGGVSTGQNMCIFTAEL